MLKYVLAWVPMVFIAIGNGILREHWYGKRLPELAAHQISTCSAIFLFGVYTWVLIWFWQPSSSIHSVQIGLCWLALTVAFEFLFGRFVAGHSWGKLLYDYNIFSGRVWILVLVWITVAPYLFYRIQR